MKHPTSVEGIIDTNPIRLLISVSVILTVAVVLTSCESRAADLQPLQDEVAVQEATSVSTQEHTPLPIPSFTPLPTLTPTSYLTEAASGLPALLPTELPSTLVPKVTAEVSSLIRVFSEAMHNYVRESWSTWEQGETIGQCLIDNAATISQSARDVVIEFGVEEAFNELSGDDLNSLSAAWDLCEAVAAQGGEEIAGAAETASTSELDEAFREAVDSYVTSTWSTWEQGQRLGQCLIASAGDIEQGSKEAVIQHGIEEAFKILSGEQSQSLSEAWDWCESQTETSGQISNEDREDTYSSDSSSKRVTIDIERDPAPTFVSQTSYDPFEDALQLAFTTSVDTEFDPVIEKAGISVSVYSDGRLWQYAKGVARSSVAMTVSTPIQIKSTSKTFMSALILDQVENGLYSLSDTVSSTLADHPGYALVDRDRINPEVTIEELLTMKSGLNTYHMVSENFVAIENNPVWKPIEHLNMTPLGYSDPGIYEYNDTNTIILAIIAEYADGRALNDLYKSRFLDPLEISAGLLPQDYEPPDTADEYGDLSKCDSSGFGSLLEACSRYTREEWLLSQGKHNWAAAGIVSTADNMARWAYELYSSNGSALSSAARAQLLNSGSVESVLFANKTHRYGYHVAIFSMVMSDGSGLDIYGHIGGGGKSVMYYSPDLDLSVAILSNSSLDHVRGVCLDHSVPFCILRSIYDAYR